MPHSLFAERLWAVLPEALPPFIATLRGLSPHRPGNADMPAPQGPGGHALSPAGATPPAAGPFGGSGEPARPYDIRNGVAVIPVRGVLAQFGLSGWYGQRIATGMLDEIRPAIDAALRDRAARAVLLDINSPGGSVAGMKELADHIAAIRTGGGKPVGAYANGAMASAAYAIGAATGRVYAPATALVGSVGIIAVYGNWSGWNEKAGISYAYLTAGKWKAVGNEDTPLSDEDRAYLQERLDIQYRHFTEGVASAMGLDLAALTTWADGRYFVASDAPKGLVTDMVADLDAAIATLAKETTMDRQTLAAQHPDLLASIERESAERAAATLDQQAKADLQARTEACVAAVRATAGDDAATRVQALLDQDLTAAQISAVAGLMPAAQPAAAAQEPGREGGAQQRILNALEQAHAAPLGAGGANRQADPVSASVQRMISMER